MKRIIIYCLILGAVLAIPVKKLDVGDLEPVQAVWIYKENGQILLETDTKDQGIGQTVDEALTDLKKHCPGIIYLDTAEYLLVSENAIDQIPAVKEHLKGSVALSLWDGQGSIEDAAKYMASHENGYPLKTWNGDVKLPVLTLRKTNEKNVEKK